MYFSYYVAMSPFNYDSYTQHMNFYIIDFPYSTSTLSMLYYSFYYFSYDYLYTSLYFCLTYLSLHSLIVCQYYYFYQLYLSSIVFIVYSTCTLSQTKDYLHYSNSLLLVCCIFTYYPFKHLIIECNLIIFYFTFRIFSSFSVLLLYICFCTGDSSCSWQIIDFFQFHSSLFLLLDVSRFLVDVLWKFCLKILSVDCR